MGRNYRGRGRGRGGRGRGGGRSSDAAGGPPPPSNGIGQQPPAIPTGEALALTLAANPEIRNRLTESNCPAQLVSSGAAEAETEGTAALTLASWADLETVLAWFRDLTDTDTSAELCFSPQLTKGQRAQVHKLAEATGLGALEAVSSGVGHRRFVKAVRKGTGKKLNLSEDDEQRAAWLRKWSGEEGHSLSVDEARELISTGNLPPALRAMWNRRLAAQQLIASLCSAISNNKPEDVKSILLQGNAGSLSALLKKECVYDEATGDGPLHLAVAGGYIEIIELLLDAGANVNAMDGRHLTPLVVARTCDQSDAEGVLLRHGAIDKDSKNWPGEGSTEVHLGGAKRKGKSPAKGGAGLPTRNGSPFSDTTATAAATTINETAANSSKPKSEAGSSSIIDVGGSNISVCGTDIADIASTAGDYMDPDYIHGSTVSKVGKLASQRTSSKFIAHEGETVKSQKQQDSSNEVAKQPEETTFKSTAGGIKKRVESWTSLSAVKDDVDELLDQCVDWTLKHSTQILASIGVVAAVTSAAVLWRGRRS